MGLSTVMQTALTGMNGAVAMINVTANNLANAQTPGFKASSVQFANLPVLSVAGGSGFNPIQIGSGVQVIGIEPDFTQGPITVNDQLPLLALDGDGLFILHSRDGRRLYTRDGQFHLNAEGQLANAEGDLVLGFGLDSAGNLDETQLTPLTIPRGSTAAGAGGLATTLRSYSINKNGAIVGRYSDGTTRTLGWLRVARFANPAGLAANSGNTFSSTAASGLPQESNPGENGTAVVLSGAQEQSNVDIGRELVELTLAGNMFRANLAVLQTADNMLAEMFFPWRAH